MAHATGVRFSRSTGRSYRRRRGKSAFWYCRNCSQYDLFVQCFAHRTHRRCRARRRRVYWHCICGGVLSAQGVGTSSGYPQSRGWGLCDRIAGTAFCRGDADHRAGWRGLSQSADCGDRILDWRGLPESGDFCGLSRRVVGGTARQWHDVRWPYGDFSDVVYGVDSPAPAARGDRARCRGFARDCGVS